MSSLSTTLSLPEPKKVMNVMNLRKKFCGLIKTSKTLAQLLSPGTVYLSLPRNMNLTLKHNRRRKLIAAAKVSPSTAHIDVFPRSLPKGGTYAIDNPGTLPALKCP